MPLIVLLIAALTSAQPTGGKADGCLRYGPDIVRITGKLNRRMFYGAPGFGEDPKHDEKEQGFYLDLAVPVCTVGRDDVGDRALTGVRRVQLVLNAAGYARLRPFLGRRVTLRGTVFGAITGHHHAPLLLDVLKPVDVVQ
jgi:hypothetical protein